MTRIEIDNQDPVEVDLGEDEQTPEEQDAEMAQEAWARQTPAEAGLEPAPEIDYDRIKRRWLIQREGKDFILYAGLVDLLHQESEGCFEIRTHVIQPPSEANGNTAIVGAEVTMGNLHRTASGIGDANPGNVSRAMAPH